MNIMASLKILRNDGGTPIVVPADVAELKIEEPVSLLTNLDEIIQSLPKLKSLIFYVTDYGKTDSTESLCFLRGAKCLKHLSLCSMPHLRDCDALVECKNLDSLSLSRHVTKVFDFGVLPSLSSLRSLSVELPSDAMVGRISKASQLTDLQLLGGFKLASLEPLAGLVNLQNLRLWSGSLTSTRGLTTFGKLEVLDLGYSKVRDTRELGSLKGLKKMKLLGNKAITSLEFLKPGELEFLGMFEIPKLESLKPLLRLSKLKEFQSGAKILDDNLLPLVGIPTLEKAHIPGRYKSALKKMRVDCSCVFKVGRETLKLSKQRALVLETASEAKERLLKKLSGG
jgi:hypothetical protein